jgi:hypothetical protein
MECHSARQNVIASYVYAQNADSLIALEPDVNPKVSIDIKMASRC